MVAVSETAPCQQTTVINVDMRLITPLPSPLIPSPPCPFLRGRLLPFELGGGGEGGGGGGVNLK